MRHSTSTARSAVSEQAAEAARLPPRHGPGRGVVVAQVCAAPSGPGCPRRLVRQDEGAEEVRVPPHRPAAVSRTNMCGCPALPETVRAGTPRQRSIRPVEPAGRCQAAACSMPAIPLAARVGGRDGEAAHTEAGMATVTSGHEAFGAGPGVAAGSAPLPCRACWGSGSAPGGCRHGWATGPSPLQVDRWR